MNSLKKTAAVLALATATAFSGAASATGKHHGGGTYYPEYPQTPTNPVNNNNHNNNNIHNSNKNNASAEANAAANAAAIAAQQQAQKQAQQQAQQQTANGGKGGEGGQGGQGGNGYGGNATGGNATGGNATGGNATGGTSSSDANATGGAANATGGQSSANSGGNSMSNTNNFEAPKPMGNVAATTIIPAGNCGEGWALNVSIPFFGAGGGKTTQSKFCLSQDAAKAAINAGLVAQDTGMVATGLAGLRNLHPEFDAAANTVVENLMKPCAAQAAKISAIMLTQPGLQCEGKYVAGTEGFIQSLQAAPAPVVPAEPLRVEIVNTVPVKIEGVVRTKEERPAVRHVAPRPRPVPAPAPKDPCGCK